MKQKATVAIFVLWLLVSIVATAVFVSSADANPAGSAPQLSMSIEHINYTITEVNGVLWAKIDGSYPIAVQRQPNCGFDGVLPMVYPTPPNTTNIHLTLNRVELAWDNAALPLGGLHRTAIGNWTMIDSVIQNVSDAFLLEIHYEHPVERINGSCALLYDLNIAGYLSEQNPNSTAIFAVRFDCTSSDVHVYTAPPDSEASSWQPKTFTQSIENSATVVLVQMDSRYASQLPGDLVVVFSANQSEPDKGDLGNGADWVFPVVIVVILVSIILYVKRKSILNE